MNAGYQPSAGAFHFPVRRLTALVFTRWGFAALSSDEATWSDDSRH
jgi:hypothetical protein